MSHAGSLSPLAAAAAALFVLLGATLTLIGAIGLLRLKRFYERVHAPTMGTTLGTGLILVASMVLFSALESRPVLHEIAIGVLMTLNTPVTFMLLMRAALHRSPPDSSNQDDRGQREQIG
jgi:multicomponent K+:H+ antiporter subunit G